MFQQVSLPRFLIKYEKKYVRKTLQDTKNIDRRILFITYSGMDEKSLQFIQNLVNQYCPFERVYLQKASPAIASNCGPGSFGLLFMRRDDAAIPFFQTPGQYDPTHTPSR